MSIKKESIKHWEIMIEWVRTQNKDADHNLFLMERKIKMNWRSEYCPYCAKHDICLDCPISKSGNCCNDENSIWRMIDDSATWSEWLIHAKKMLSMLESLPEEDD